MAQHGGRRAGAGRKPGVVSKAKRDLASRAKDLADQALATLADIMINGESETARISAANAILDRGYGRPMQAHEVSGPDGGEIPISITVTFE